MGCHLAGACPFEAFDISPWAEAAFQHFLRHPFAQRLPRKFKINFSGCDTDCGQAMFNDVGVIATTRTLEDGTIEQGFRVFVAGGLGANPHPALALEDFTAKEDLLPTIESVLRVFEQTGNRDNKLRARLKWVVDELGIDEVRRRVMRTRHFLLASSSWPGGIPEVVQQAGRRPGRRGHRRHPHRHRPGHPGRPPRHQALRALGRRQRRARRGQGHGLGHRLRQARRHHHRPVPGARLDHPRARARRAPHQPPEHRLPRPHRGPAAHAVRPARGHRHGRARRRAGPRRRGLPRRRHLQPGRHPVPRPGRRHRHRPRGGRPGRGRRRPHQHLRLHQLVRPAPRRRHRLLRRRAPGPRPVRSRLPDAARRLRRPGADALRREGPAPAGPQRPRGHRAGRAPVRRASARPARTSAAGSSARAAPRPSPTTLRDLDHFPTPDEAPEYYVDFGETGPYVAEIGESECAT